MQKVVRQRIRCSYGRVVADWMRIWFQFGPAIAVASVAAGRNVAADPGESCVETIADAGYAASRAAGRR